MSGEVPRIVNVIRRLWIGLSLIDVVAVFFVVFAVVIFEVLFIVIDQV